MVPMWIEMFLLDDVERLTQLLYISLTELALFAKYINLVSRNKKIRELVEITNLPEYNSKNLSEDKVFGDTWMYVTAALSFYVAVFFCCVTSIGGAALMNDLPFYHWYFSVDWRKSRTRFWIFYAYQAIGMTMHAFTNTACDCLLPYLLSFIRTQFILVKHRVENLNFRSEDVRKDFLEHIKLHQWIIGYAQDVQNTFSGVVFIQFCISGFVICFTAFNISTVTIF
jgi:hypothetical protein